MASTSSSSSLGSSQQNHTRFDVFLSFRGEDTRNNFTDHLFHASKRAGLRTFRDDDEIERSEELKPEIERAIIESRASIIVLSENYANSKWCLDELYLILDQRRKNNHFLLPVFYHVHPSDVRNQRGSFAMEIEEGVEVSKWTMDNISKWKTALTEVANLTGMVVSGQQEQRQFQSWCIRYNQIVVLRAVFGSYCCCWFQNGAKQEGCIYCGWIWLYTSVYKDIVLLFMLYSLRLKIE